METDEFLGLLFILMIVGAVIIGSFLSLTAVDLAVSQGTFRGKVIDAEYTGIIWKNYVFHVQRTYNETFAFTICHDTPNVEQLFQKVQEAQKQGKEIIVGYADRVMYWKWICNGGATPVVSIEIGD